LRKKITRYAKKAKQVIEKETANTYKDNQDKLGHNDERVDIFYNPNKVSKGDIFIGLGF